MDIQSPKKRAVSESQIKNVLVVLMPGYLSLRDNLTLRLGVGKEEIGSHQENSFENQGFILVLKHYFLSAPKLTVRNFSIKFKNRKMVPLRELSYESKMRLKMSFRGLSELSIIDKDSEEIYQFLQLFERLTVLNICNSDYSYSTYPRYQYYRIGPQHIQHLQYLKRLRFSGGEINSITIKFLGNLKSLNELNIHDCTFLEGSEQGLKELTGLKELRMTSNKYISFKNLDDSYLCHLTGLKVLDLDRITAVKYLCSLRNLESLTLVLDLDELTMDISFVDSGTLNNLSSLYLYSPEYMNLEGISQFCPNLENLNLYSEDESDYNFCQAINPLVGLLKLKSLQISIDDDSCTKVSQIGDIYKITSLTSLKLWFKNPLSYEFCNSLNCLTRLEILSLWLIEQNSGTINNLDCLKYLPRTIHTLELNCVNDLISEVLFSEVLYNLSEQTNITCLDLENDLEFLENDASREREFFMSLDRYIVTNKNLECITGYVDKVEMSRKREELLEKKVLPYIIR